MTPTPAKHFANPPYRAELFSEKSGWAGVMNTHGVNCLTFVQDGKTTGKVVTTYDQAQKIAQEWNK
jgi:hypothetical protein